MSKQSAQPTLKVIQGGKSLPAVPKQRQKEIKDGLRKTLLNAAEANAMLSKYGIKIDNLPLTTLGHAHRMFNLANGNVMAMTHSTSQGAEWIVYVPERGYWMVESARLTAQGYVVAVGDLLRTWAEQLEVRLAKMLSTAKKAAPAPPKDPTVMETKRAAAAAKKAKAEADADTQAEEILTIMELISELHKQAARLQTPGGISQVLSMALVRKPEAFMKYHINESMFDTDNDHIVVRNGVIDLRVGKLLKHDPKYRFTRHIDVDYDPAALKRESSFLTLVERMFPDPDVRAFMQRSAGYWLTGFTEEQAVWIMFGLSGTGKSTFMDAVAGAMGTRRKSGYSAPATAGLLRVKDSHWGDTATIQGARLLIDAETGEDTVLDSARLKRLTGDRGMTGNQKYGKHVEFDVTAKIVLMTNHPPVFDSGGAKDESIYRRLFVVPCNVQMYLDAWKSGTYLELPKMLKSEAERQIILAWMVAGAKQWYQKPLRSDVPARIQEEIEALRTRSGGGDPIMDAITAAGYVITYNDSDIVAAQELIEVIQAARPTSPQAIGRWCSSHALQSTKKRWEYKGVKGVRAVYFGIKAPVTNVTNVTDSE